MTGRDRRYGRSRSASLKARLGIATAVLVGGGAIGVAAVAASGHSAPAPAKAAAFSEHHAHFGETWVSGWWQNASFFSFGRWHHHHTWHHGFWQSLNTGSLLSTALYQWQWSQNNAFNLFSHLPSRDTQTTFHNTRFAVQRGIVVLATHHFLIVRSFNGTLRLWVLSGNTQFQDVSNTWTGTNALTGGNMFVTNQMMNANNATPLAQLLAGTLGQAQQLVTPVAKPTTISVNVAGTGFTVTVTVTTNTATVMQQTPTATTTSFQNPFAFTRNVQRGDLVLVAGIRSHGFLHAALVAFVPLNATMIPGTPATPATPVAPVPSSTLSGTHS
ncbi:MAG: hypothetical protein JOY82_25540 [Streptosporangiaceae bacterium]|nr:hypothetical protein [Streptosporangiaceae bacterium]MBV9857850.1 hypothetical protein [Streptosporangiaceae bacterium]